MLHFKSHVTPNATNDSESIQLGFEYFTRIQVFFDTVSNIYMYFRCPRSLLIFLAIGIVILCVSVSMHASLIAKTSFKSPLHVSIPLYHLGAPNVGSQALSYLRPAIKTPVVKCEIRV